MYCTGVSKVASTCHQLRDTSSIWAGYILSSKIWILQSKWFSDERSYYKGIKSTVAFFEWSFQETLAYGNKILTDLILLIIIIIVYSGP